MTDLEQGEIADQASSTPPRLDRVGLSEGRDTTHFSNGAEGPSPYGKNLHVTYMYDIHVNMYDVNICTYMST